jgi:hypothetical protein
MHKTMRQFVCEENKKYKFMVGNIVASSLTGFIGGIVVASIIWYVVIYFR